MRRLPIISVSSALAISLASCPLPLEPVPTCQAFAERSGVMLGEPSRGEVVTEAWTYTHFWDATAEHEKVECSVRDGRLIRYVVGDREIRRRN